MTPDGIAEYCITDHARAEMQRRRISEDIVCSVLAAPEQVFAVREGRMVFQSRVSFGGTERLFLVRVFVDISPRPPEVVTVYRTSKVEKYWERAE